MTPEELLSQLKEIHEPAAIGNWPLAPGWWILIVITLFIALLIAYLLRAYLKKNAWKKEATRTITSINQQVNDLGHHQSLYLINQLIKRIATHKQNDSSIKTLTGKPWFEFMDSFLNGPNTPNMLSHEQLELLSDGQYKSDIDADKSMNTKITSLLKALHNWIKEA